MMNAHLDVRLSRCPKCEKLTYPRKFPLLIHVEGWGPFTLGLTCKYCSRCEMIMCHQYDLEAELANTFQRLKPEVIGNDYLVLGTVEKKVWQQGLKTPLTLDETLRHTADFKKYTDLDYDPGGWRPAEDKGFHPIKPRRPPPEQDPWRKG